MEKLWEIIEKENIKVKYRHLSHERETLYGLYLLDDSGPIIILDHSLKTSRRLSRCVLAEEIGHYYTAPRTNFLTAYTSYSTQLTMSKDERKAMMWATDFLIPDRELCKALKSGLRSCYELAEHFDVTEWFMYRKMGFLKMCFRRTGLKVKGRDLFQVEMQLC